MTDGLLYGLNYLASLVASSVFLFLLQRRKELLIKPSIQILLYTHVFIQWPAALRQELVTSMLPFPFDAFLLIHGFVLAGLAVSLTTWHGHAREIYLRMTNTGVNYLDQSMPYVTALLGLCALAAVIHIRSVPISELGLFVAIADPQLAEAAREESFKLLDSAMVRYGFSLQTSTFAPLSAVFVFGLMTLAIRRCRFIAAVACVTILLAILLIVSMTGARIFAALIFVSIAASVVLRRGFSVNPVWVLLAAVIVILPPVILTLLRQGLLTDLTLIPEYFWFVIGDRIFGLPLQVGLWYMQHEQVFGSIGISGVSRIAELFGIPAINLPNQIGLMYTSTTLLSVSANASFLFTFYAYFGIIALPICLVALWSLDCFLLLLLRLDSQLLLPTLAAMAAAGLSFLSSDFSVTLVSHGYGLIPIVAFALVVIRRMVSSRPKQREDLT